MRRIRFSLRLLSLLVSALALYLGYSQYRRREILTVVGDLKADGYVFTVKDGWFDRCVWQRKPIAGTILEGDKPALVCRKVSIRRGQTIKFATYNAKEVRRFEKSGLVNYTK